MSVPPLQIERCVLIFRPQEEVYDFVAQPLNDPSWCPKVLEVSAIAHPAATPAAAGSTYTVRHRPIPLRPARELHHRCVAADRPSAMSWHEQEHDGTHFLVRYSLRAQPNNQTLFCQHTEAHVAVPRALRGLFRVGIGRDLATQLRHLKRQLEAGRAA